MGHLLNASSEDVHSSTFNSDKASLRGYLPQDISILRSGVSKPSVGSSPAIGSPRVLTADNGASDSGNIGSGMPHVKNHSRPRQRVARWSPSPYGYALPVPDLDDFIRQHIGDKIEQLPTHARKRDEFSDGEETLPARRSRRRRRRAKGDKIEPLPTPVNNHGEISDGEGNAGQTVSAGRLRRHSMSPAPTPKTYTIDEMRRRAIYIPNDMAVDSRKQKVDIAKTQRDSTLDPPPAYFPKTAEKESFVFASGSRKMQGLLSALFPQGEELSRGDD